MPLLKSSKSLTYRGDKTRERYINQIKIFFLAEYELWVDDINMGGDWFICLLLVE